MEMCGEKKSKLVFVTRYSQEKNKPIMLPIEKLIQKPFILTEMGAAYQYELERLLAGYGLEVNPILETGNTDSSFSY